MAKVSLTPTLVASLKCPSGRKKIDYFDVLTKGLHLEVRASGNKTFYLRYKNSRNKTRNFKLADARDVTLSQARGMADKGRNRVVMGEDPCEAAAEAKQMPKFYQFIEDSYLPHVKSYKRSWTTDLSLLKTHLLPRFRERYLDEITRQDILKMRNDRIASGAAPGSANRLLIMMRFIFSLAIQWKLPGITNNPAKEVPLLEENNLTERYLSIDEARRLYEAVSTSENTVLKFIVSMLILTGARKRELLDSQWQDFDLSRRSWRIPLTKAGKARHVPLSDGALSVLNEIQRIPDCPFVFANPRTRKPYVSFFCAWNTARIKAGLADVRVHDLRHSFASLLINKGRTLYEVQRILGHTQVKTTMRYAHLSHDTLLDAANAATLSVGVAMSPLKSIAKDELHEELPEATLLPMKRSG
jgi:integrase